MSESSARTSGEVFAHTPGPGTWWFLAEFPGEPGRDSLVEISTLQTGIALAWVDAHGEIHETEREKGKIVLPLVPAMPTRVLIRATTTEAARFTIYARQHLFRQDKRDTPCDPDHIDRRNPNCEDVYPRCDRTKPDHSNPNCCTVPCGGSCTSKVVSGGDKFLTIALGTANGITLGARGRVEQRDKVSDVVVVDLSEHQALVQVAQPQALDATKLEEMRVFLSPPSQCALPRQRRGL